MTSPKRPAAGNFRLLCRPEEHTTRKPSITRHGPGGGRAYNSHVRCCVWWDQLTTNTRLTTRTVSEYWTWTWTMWTWMEINDWWYVSSHISQRNAVLHRNRYEHDIVWRMNEMDAFETKLLIQKINFTCIRPKWTYPANPFSIFRRLSCAQ